MKQVRVTYSSEYHSYSETLHIDENEDPEWIEGLEKAKGTHSAQATEVVGLVEALSQSDYCPMIFIEEPILTVKVEFEK